MSRYIVVGSCDKRGMQAEAGYLPVVATDPELAAQEARKQGWEVYRVFDEEDVENMWSDVQPCYQNNTLECPFESVRERDRYAGQ